MARQEAAQALDCLCAEREGRAQDALQLQDAVPLSKHKEALSAVSEQLAQTLQELQEERTLRSQAEEQAARLEAKLQAVQDAIPKEEHEKVKVSRNRKSYETDPEWQFSRNVFKNMGARRAYRLRRR